MSKPSVSPSFAAPFCLGGPEGGLPVTLVLLAGIALALFAPEKNTAAQELSA